MNNVHITTASGSITIKKSEICNPMITFVIKGTNKDVALALLICIKNGLKNNFHDYHEIYEIKLRDLYECHFTFCESFNVVVKDDRVIDFSICNNIIEPWWFLEVKLLLLKYSKLESFS